MQRKEIIKLGKVIIQPETNKTPITTIGRMIGICYGSDISDDEKNYKRGMNCLKAGHGRSMEFATCFMSIQGYSARVIRELYTHIGGAPTRVQESTRYIDYSDFDYIIPANIEANWDTTRDIYVSTINMIQDAISSLIKYYDIPKEDAAMLLPMCMTTGISCHYNLRTLENMANQRFCMRAYWEYRDLMKDIKDALSEYSEEWKTLCDMFFMAKCERQGYCHEEFSCGRYPQKIDD